VLLAILVVFPKLQSINVSVLNVVLTLHTAVYRFVFIPRCFSSVMCMNAFQATSSQCWISMCE